MFDVTGRKLLLSNMSAKAEHLQYLSSHHDTKQYLHRLPSRVLPRPLMIKWFDTGFLVPLMCLLIQCYDRPAPQRQLTERGTPMMLDLVQQGMMSIAEKHSLITGPSLREAHEGLAIYAQKRGPGVTPRITADRLHSHPLCGSLHVHLHPLDALEVVRAGWGEPFALACCGRRSNCHDGLVLVYAPRGKDGLEVVNQIIEAGAMYLLTRLE